MKMRKEIVVRLDAQGVDEASDAIQSWLKEAGVEHAEILRVRLMTENLLDDIRRNMGQPEEAKLILMRIPGSFYLVIQYGKERFDPTHPEENEVTEMSRLLLTEIGLKPTWRWRSHHNEVIIHMPGRHMRPEHLMLGCILVAVIIGLAGPFIPPAVRNVITDYGLSFISEGFLNLLNTFIGLMVFLSVVNGICGIGNVSVLGKVGKLMIGRYAAVTFICCAVYTLAACTCFPLSSGAGGGTGQFHSVLEMFFGILPSNPIKPFLEGNSLQIVFLAIMVGTILLLTGSQTEYVRNLVAELHAVVMRCVTLVCVFLPAYIFSSLVTQLWTGGPALFTRFGKPILLTLLMCIATMAVYLMIASWKLKVKPSVILPKIMPATMIAFSTSSSSAALPTLLDSNEKKLGIDSSFSKMAAPIGGILFASAYSIVFVLNAAFLAEHFGMQVNTAWWITLWIVASLLAMSVPPVAGGVISCLTVLTVQMKIPMEGLALAVTLATLMDFFCTACRVFLLQLEITLQADKLKLLNRKILEQK